MRREERKPYYLTEHLYCHHGLAGDQILQPSFAVQTVITEPLRKSTVENLWSLVTSYEGIDPSVGSKGRELFSHYILYVSLN